VTDKPLPDTVARWKDGERPHYYENFLRMSAAERKWHADKDRAIWEARRRNAERTISPSYFAPEGGLDEALRRFKLDPFGNDLDPLGGSGFVEPPTDTRSRDVIQDEARAKMREFIERTLFEYRERNALAEAERNAP